MRGRILQEQSAQCADYKISEVGYMETKIKICVFSGPRILKRLMKRSLILWDLFFTKKQAVCFT